MSDYLVEAGPLHAEALARIHAAAFATAEAWSAEAFRALLAQPSVFALIDPQGGLVMARVAADEAEILTLAVAPTVRRQGRARLLLSRAAGAARARGASALFLEVDNAHAAAIRLYAAAGFTKVARRPAYYANGGDALVMRQELG